VKNTVQRFQHICEEYSAQIGPANVNVTPKAQTCHLCSICKAMTLPTSYYIVFPFSLKFVLGRETSYSEHLAEIHRVLLSQLSMLGEFFIG
jgi:hypothetical protein